MQFLEKIKGSKILLVSMVLLQIFRVSMKWLFPPTPHWGALPILLVLIVVFGMLIFYSPNATRKFIQLFESFESNEKAKLIILTLVILIIGLLFAISFDRHNDEIGNFAASRLVAESNAGMFFDNYAEMAWLGTQHPPLAPLVFGLAMRIFGVNLLVMRFTNLLFFLGTLLLVYSMCRLLNDGSLAGLSVLLLLSFPLYSYYSVIANNDMLVVFFFTLALFLTIRLINFASYRLSIFIGLVIGAGLLAKYTMLLVFPIILLWIVMSKKTKQLFYHMVIFIFISVGIFGGWLAFADHLLVSETPGDGIGSVLDSQVEKVSSYAGVESSQTGEINVTFFNHWRRKFIFESLIIGFPTSLGLYNVPAVLLGFKSMIQSRNSIDRLFLVWIIMVLVPVFLTLPVSRYFFPAYPVIAVMVARGYRMVSTTTTKYVLLSLFFCCMDLFLMSTAVRNTLFIGS